MHVLLKANKNWFFPYSALAQTAQQHAIGHLIISQFQHHRHFCGTYQELQAKTIHVTFNLFSNKRFQSAKVGLNVN